MSNGEYNIEDVKREAGLEQRAKMHTKRIQLIIFKIGDEEYGLPIEQIKEVVLTPRIAKMPQTPPYIKGVANIRGNIIAIMDLGQKFGIAEQLEDNRDGIELSHYTLVVESEKYKVGVLVKEVPNTLTVATDDIDPASDFIQYSSLDADSLVGVVKSGERMIILIDMLKLIASENMDYKS